MKTISKDSIGIINIHDSEFRIMEESVDESDYKDRVFDPMIRLLRDKGWSVRRDPEIYKNYRILSKHRRYCRKGDLEAKLSLSGRCIEFEMYQNIVNVENRNGGKYDFDKLGRMPYLMRTRVELTFNYLTALVAALGSYTIKPRNKKLGPGGLTGEQWVQTRNEESAHFRPELGRADWSYDSNRKSGDGTLLEHKQHVYFKDYAGRILTGVAYYNLNNMWWVLSGKYTVSNICCSSIYTTKPDDIRTKRNERIRRNRLEKLLAEAVKQMNYLRADQLKQILFKDYPLFLIRSTKDGLFYRSNYSGYTSDTVEAGKYTKIEIDKSGYRSAIQDGHLELVPVNNAA